MSDEKPDLTQTEARQGNSRKMNLRALVIGLVLIAAAFAVALWFSTMLYDDTSTGVDSGATLEDSAEESLEETPLPEPGDENLVGE